ncbi:hypothetical protein F5Y18DRAFT_79076 [Xylariaceae sp. FL1019]|nr:hypothetical protein F5Y18DRAFT_79076 [Xylariaceae sp. FL1019]
MLIHQSLMITLLPFPVPPSSSRHLAAVFVDLGTCFHVLVLSLCSLLWLAPARVINSTVFSNLWGGLFALPAMLVLHGFGRAMQNIDGTAADLWLSA